MSETEKQLGVLREVANFLRRLTDEQVEQLNRGEARIVLTQRSPTGGKGKTTREGREFNLTHVRSTLQGMNSRDEGREFLDELRMPRSALQELATGLDMVVNKSDTVDKIKDLVVEATIGYRLRSNAIRGIDADQRKGAY